MNLSATGVKTVFIKMKQKDCDAFGNEILTHIYLGRYQTESNLFVLCEEPKEGLKLSQNIEPRTGKTLVLRRAYIGKCIYLLTKRRALQQLQYIFCTRVTL